MAQGEGSLDRPGPWAPNCTEAQGCYPVLPWGESGWTEARLSRQVTREKL